MTPPPLPPSDPSQPFPNNHQAVPPPVPAGQPAWQNPLLAPVPPPRAKTRPVFWILLAVIVAGVVALLAAGASASYSKITKGLKAKQSKAEIEKLNASLNDEMQKELETSGSISGERSVEHMQKVQRLLESAGTGTDAAAMESRAAATWTKKVMEATKAHTEASQKVQELSLMDAGVLKSREDISARREPVKAFAQSNQALGEVFQSAEKDFADALRDEGMTAAEIPKHAKGFVGSLRKQMPLMEKIRGDDATYADLMSKWLDLMDQEWDAWKVGGDGAITFEKAEAQEKWAAILADVNRVAESQSAAQKQLLDLQNK